MTPLDEKDACGVAFLADLKGRASHEIVAQALVALHNLDHRGAAGAEPSSGDGAGITVALPDGFLRSAVTFELPPRVPTPSATRSCPAIRSWPPRPANSSSGRSPRRGSRCSAGRELPTNSSDLGPTALSVMPRFEQLFVAGAAGERGLDLERLAFCARKVAERQAREAGIELYFSSLSARTLVYKGMLTTDQLGVFFPDLTDPAFASAIALVHSRFSTNTFPSWPLAHPFATSPTTARSTPSMATATGCNRARRCLRATSFPVT